MAVYNVHERTLPVPPERLGPLLDGLASPDDRLWPGGQGRWPPMEFGACAGPAEGARGGHGPVRYTVAAYVPGRWVRFRFTAPRGFHGFHEYTVHSAPETADPGDEAPGRAQVPCGGAVLRHTLVVRLRGAARLSWPLVFRRLHDAVLEDSLDRAEEHCTGAVARPARWSPYVRLLRRLAGARRGPESR